MIFAIFLLNSALLLLSLLNYLTIRRPSGFRSINESVVVLLPMRNEELNVERVITELLNQEGLKNFRVVAINDNSDDRTSEIARKLTSSTLKVIDSPEPLSGWIGKVSALQHAFTLPEVQSADIVISVDADVSFDSQAIARAVATLLDSHVDFISPYPQQIAKSWAERLAQPLLQWSWMSTVLLRGAEKIPMTSTVICNGQFLAMKGSSLRAINGFESVAHKVLDDIELGRTFIANGFRGAVIDGSHIASTRMYSSFSELRSGYSKSLHTAFGGIIGSVIAALFIFSTGVIPFFYAIDGDLLAIAALIAILGTRLVSASASAAKLRDSFLHPLSSLLFIYLLYFSWINRGKSQWKGRTL